MIKGANCAPFKENRTMKNIAIAIGLLATLLVSCDAALAQQPAPKSTPVTIVPDLAKLNLEKMLQQVRTANVQPNSEDISPLQIVAAFLQLQPGQINELGQLLQARRATLVPLVQAAQAQTQQLAMLLNSGGNPAQVGTLLIQIHGLQMQMAQVQQAFLAQFVATLDPEQLQKLQAAQIAAQLQPVLPAFQPIFLF
jgi:hypothetical protein